MDEDLFRAAIAGNSHEERLWLTTSGYLESLAPSVADIAYRAAIVHWFNEEVLIALIGENGPPGSNGEHISLSQVKDIYRQLQSFPFIESYNDTSYNFHSHTRKVVLDHLWGDRNAFYRSVSGLAAKYFGDDFEKGADISTAYLVECIYHRIVTDETVVLDLASQLIEELSKLGIFDVVYAMIESIQEQYDAKRVSDYVGWSIQIWRARLANELGNYEDAVQMAVAVEARANDAVPRWVQADMAALAGEGLTQLGRFDEALRWLQRAQEYENPESPFEIAANFSRLGTLLRRWNRYADAETALLDGIEAYVSGRLMTLRRTETSTGDQADGATEVTWTSVNEGQTDGIVPQPTVHARHPEAWRKYDDQIYTIAVKAVECEDNEPIEFPEAWPLIVDSFLAQLWLRVSFVYEDMDDYPRATSSGELSSQIALDVEDDGIATDAAQLLYRLGAKGQDSQRLGRAVIRQQKRLLASAVNRGDKRVQVQAHLNLGTAFIDTLELDQAREHLTEALALTRELGDVSGQSNAFENLAVLDWTQGAYTSAAESFQRALHLLQEGGFLDRQPRLLTQMAAFDLSRHHPDEARERYVQALDLFRRLEIPAGEFSALSGLGSVAQDRLEFARAADFYGEALAAARKTSSPTLEADALSMLAQVETSQREFRKALEHYDRAIELTRLTGNRSMETELLEGIGYAYLNQGQAQEALGRFREARRIASDLKRVDRELAALSGMMAAHRGLGHVGLAAKTAETIISVSRRTVDQDLKIQAWQDASLAFSDANQHKRAVELLERAIDTDPDNPSLLGSLGWALLMAEDYERALSVSNQAFARDPTVTFAMANKALALLALGQAEAALAAYQKAVHIRPESADFADDIKILRRFLDDHPDVREGLDALRLLESEQAKLSSVPAHTEP